MTISKTTPSEPTGIRHIKILQVEIPNNAYTLYDVYVDDVFLGSGRTKVHTDLILYNEMYRHEGVKYHDYDRLQYNLINRIRS